MKTARPITSIKIGKRHRRAMGDIAALAASIEAIGLLHPVFITPEGKLIAGERRLLACKHLGWMNIPVTVVDVGNGKIVRGEYAEKRTGTRRVRAEPKEEPNRGKPAHLCTGFERPLAVRLLTDGGGER
jgi:ParB-like nuclease domain